MTPVQYQRVGDLFDEAMELAPDARPGFLLRACGGDEELRREVESLLRAREEADGFIAGKVAGVVAEMAERVRKPRGRMAEPAHIYNFTEEDLT